MQTRNVFGRFLFTVTGFSALQLPNKKLFKSIEYEDNIFKYAMLSICRSLVFTDLQVVLAEVKRYNETIQWRA